MAPNYESPKVALRMGTRATPAPRPLSQEAFDALCELTRLLPSASTLAARRVLVDGARAVDAAHEEGITAQAVRNACARLRKALALARIAAK